ncbi:GTP-binding protein Di-Ras2-like protein, partial [Leptotrombidium deliense]
MGEVSYHVRLVILGGGGVGKTGIVKRFLFNTFCEKHRPTVEDLFFKEFNLGTMILK